MKVVRTEIPELLILEPQPFNDERGFFLETHNRKTFSEATGLSVDFVQDNLAFSVRNVLRGLHYQIRQPQGKLITVIAGEIYDVAVDIRRSSPTFGKWAGVTITGGGHRMLWIPAGFAHGYMVLSEHAIVSYKASDFYAPQHERAILWSDPAIGIRWPLQADPILSAKDVAAPPLARAEPFP